MTKEELKEQGLTNNHAYTLLDARVIEDPSSISKKARLVKIRNPYAGSKPEWHGQWSDNSK
jgi:hypothetical protein